MTNKIYEECIMTLADPTLIDREEAAFNAADNMAMAEAMRDVWKERMGSLSSVPNIMKRVRKEATRRRIEAIGF